MTARDDVVDYLQRHLLGPTGGDRELLPDADPPHERYLLGTLFPRNTSHSAAVRDDEIVDEQAGEIGEDITEDPIVLANQQMPSSQGISFVVSGPAVMVSIRAARYGKGPSGWHRHPCTTGLLQVTPDSPHPIAVLDGDALIYHTWRPRPDGSQVVTLAVVNPRTTAARGRPDAASCLFQVTTSVTPSENHRILPYPTSGHFHLDEEAEELAILYRNHPSFAVGHGCATGWTTTADGTASEIHTTYLPQATVPGVDFEIPGFDHIRSLRTLATLATSPAPVIAELRRFVEAFEAWTARQEAGSRHIPPPLQAARTRLLERLHVSSLRMRSGIDLLEKDPDARAAFALANEAMIRQMRHSAPDLGGTRRPRTSAPYVEPDYASTAYHWRPFQLAFLLLTIAGCTDPASPERSLVDLIWFPTGGGKTEAYLGLTAYVILLRRIRHGDWGNGTAVITRYTLRLLTSQQFQRAAALMCALETIRRDRQRQQRLSIATLGSAPITIGIWLGGSSSPNTCAEARELLETLVAGGYPGLSYQLEVCPWCGTEIIPEKATGNEADYGVDPDHCCAMYCPSPDCPFSTGLPIASVDEALYASPPTVLIATVDKFAQAVWRGQAGRFLGCGPEPGPDLIIQDELHLISGPLGTLAAIYESAFDLAISIHGFRPKVIASTATIRNSARHVQGIFGREVFVFPAAGLDADDSYFVRFDREAPGRTYVGLMPQAHTPTTGLVRTAATLLQAPIDLKFTGDDLDQFWTLVAYHNSLRELGRTVTLTRDDIPAWIEVIAHAHDAQRQIDPEEHVIELTSNIPPYLIPRNLEALQRPAGAPGAVSLVACTNMISVGVDVQRLGLMVVCGQPKSTSEYIQATSRIGRSRPGLVVTLYSPAKSRDRSHYETFSAYHASLYRQVEATSVTPFSIPARERALHAAMVILVRHGLGHSGNDQAGDFDPTSPEAAALLERYLERVAWIDPSEAATTRLHLDRLLAEWRTARDAATTGRLYYDAWAPHRGLLRRFNENRPGWPTLDSMRSVDVETIVKVTGE